MTLQRGFKSAAEKRAEQVRAELGLDPWDALDPRDVANTLNISVVSASDLVGLKRLEELEDLQTFAFSAATFEIGARKIIVTNPLRTPGRTNSDLAHELAHVLLEHELSEVREVSGVPFRTCRADQEEEATTLGATLLLPRPLLVAAVRRNSGPSDIASQYGVTVEMARYRYNTTGVAKQSGVRQKPQ